MLHWRKIYHLMKTKRSDFGKRKVLSPTESNVNLCNYFKYKNMLHNISELSSGAVRSKLNILYDFHEPWRTASMRFGKDSYNLLMKSSGIAKKAVLHAPRVHQDYLVSSSMLPLSSYPRHAQWCSCLVTGLANPGAPWSSSPWGTLM